MKSMTGYGSDRGRAGHSHFLVEARSVNHRFCETNIRLPGRLSLLEHEIAALVRRRFVRGKFDLFIKEEAVGRDQAEINLAKRCYAMLAQIQKSLRLRGPIGLGELLAFRNVYLQNPSESEEISAVQKGLLRVATQALDKLERMRVREGGHLKKWFDQRMRRLRWLLVRLEREAHSSQNRRRLKLEKRFQKNSSLPQERVAEGAALMANRSDVTEEVIRLKSHLKQFDKNLQVPEAVGRKLDFLAQEMGREINTLGSKVTGVRAVHHVIDFKTELEKIREQVQNVE